MDVDNVLSSNMKPIVLDETLVINEKSLTLMVK
jgi:hypothetical protein